MSLKSKVSTIVITLILSSYANATVIQYFWGNTYNNPAMLNSTKHQSYTIGTLGVNERATFWGIGASGINGQSSTNTTNLLPYFSGAYRVNSKVVVGLNISMPYYAAMNFDVTPTTLYDGSKASLYTSDISPQISYQASDKLAIGLGFDAVNFHGFENNFVPFGMPAAGTSISKAGGWGYGWNAGLFYTVTERDFISLYYYSKLTPSYRGTSYNNIAATRNYFISGLPLAATTFANYIRMLTDKWLLSLKISLSQWDRLNTIVLNNVATAGNVSFPVYGSNTLAYTLFTKYQITPKYAVMGGFFRDSAAYKNNTRPLLYSSSRFGFLFLGANAQVTKEILLQLSGGYGSYRNTPIINPFGYATNGHLKLTATLIDFSIVYSI